jgi:uncharacterized protein YbjT (DUF2867 family)
MAAEPPYRACSGAAGVRWGYPVMTCAMTRSGHNAQVRVLVTGATGYIGGRLAPRLVEEGHQVRATTRSASRLRDLPWAARAEIVEADVLDSDRLAAALEGVEVAYYLVHSIPTGKDFTVTDRRAARTFAARARAAGVRRIVYLGGMPGGGADASRHLSSRAEVGTILLDSGVPTIMLQAAVVVGSGSASFEMLRYLTERLPVMVTPPPTPDVLAGLVGKPNDFGSLADLVDLAIDNGFRPLAVSMANTDEWDTFESRWCAGRERWLLAHPDAAALVKC